MGIKSLVYHGSRHVKTSSCEDRKSVKTIDFICCLFAVHVFSLFAVKRHLLAESESCINSPCLLFCFVQIFYVDIVSRA